MKLSLNVLAAWTITAHRNTVPTNTPFGTIGNKLRAYIDMSDNAAEDPLVYEWSRLRAPTIPIGVVTR